MKAKLWIESALTCLLAAVSFAGGTKQFTLKKNPIIWADVPDVAAIRVGDTYCDKNHMILFLALT